MDKLKMHSPDLIASNIERLVELFPGCVTESRGEDGALKRAIDFDLLRQELSDHLVEGPQERYRLDWPGKREALLAANAPIAKTLRPCREESVDFDSTRNLFIEGDNLEALKLLQETYLGKVKMIYIDPPYNTGNDFIYDDDFSIDAHQYLERSAQQQHGIRMVANTQANGRFHSDWLSMLYPRLKLARHLLRPDGAILISIDENEVANLRLCCDEVFGSENFVADFVWETKRAARGVPPRSLLMANHEYVVCYAADISNFALKGLTRDPGDFANPDNDPRGLWRSESIRATGKQDNYFNIVDSQTGVQYHGNWAFSKASIERMMESDLILFPSHPGGTPRQKKFIDSYTNETKASVTSLGWHSTEASTKALMEIFDGAKIFDFPKPLSLVTYFCEQILSSDQLAMDFFAGSGTTMHAVMESNARDGGRRRCISVQLPEVIEEDNTARNAGYATIADIAKERIRRADQKIKADNAGSNGIENLDTGFRVLKIDTSNMAEVYYRPDELKQDDLLGQVDNIRPGRSAEDLLFQVLLDWGVDLALPIVREDIDGREVFFVDGNALAACFVADGRIDEALVKQIAQRQPIRVVFRDAGFASDNARINAEQIFKALSPSTEVRTL